MIGRRDADPGAPGRVTWIEASLLLALAVVVRLGTLEHAPAFDELYHLLAARSWAEEGTLRIADGLYGRAAGFTILIGWLFRIFGDSLAVARLPSLVAGSLLVPVVFVWTRRAAGRTAAWIAALLLCVAPLALFVSGYIRFYAVHGLLWFLAAACFYAVAGPGGTVRREAVLAGAGALLLAAAFYLQVTTAIGVAGLVVWLGLERATGGLGAASGGLGAASGPTARRLWIAFGLAALGLGIVVAIAVASGVAQELWGRYRWAAVWSVGRDARFYHWALVEKYPTLWPLLPVAALLALGRRRRPAFFAASLLFVGVALHSFAGMKAERFLYYLLPYFFILWGIAIAELLPVLARAMREGAARALRLGAEHPWSRSAGLVAAAGALAFLLLANGAFLMAGRMMLGEPAYAEVGGTPFRESAEADWDAAAPALRPWIERADVVVTTNGMKTLYHFGDYDVELSPTRLSDLGGEEFLPDPRTGRRVIASPAALRRVIDCHESGLFLSPPAPLAEGGAPLRELLRERTEPLDLPGRSGLSAFVWRHAGESAPTRRCDVPAGRASTP